MKKEINIILGERVKMLRNKQGYTREAFSEMISVSPRFLADLESGNVGVSISTLKTISQKLNISSDYLIGLKEMSDYEIEKENAIQKISSMTPELLSKVNTVMDCMIDITK